MDYVVCDSRLGRMIRSTEWVKRSEVGFPSDHHGLFTEFTFEEDMECHRRRRAHKPIWWQPRDPDMYRRLTQQAFEGRYVMPLSEISQTIEEIARAESAPRRRSRPQGHSATEARLRHVLSSAVASAEEKRAATEAMWHARHAIRTEKMTSTCSHVLDRLRDGGWGQRHLTARHSCMPFLATRDGPVTDVISIAPRNML